MILEVPSDPGFSESLILCSGGQKELKVTLQPLSPAARCFLSPASLHSGLLAVPAQFAT